MTEILNSISVLRITGRNSNAKPIQIQMRKLFLGDGSIRYNVINLNKRS